MANDSYTIEKNAQITIALLKAKGIKKVVASPGTTNISIVGSMMHDTYFEMYSAADERSAAYIACGLSAESGEPVVLTCTGATASRNYLPGLTEAYYRKLPIIALTSALNIARSGHLQPQFCDRTRQPIDTVKYSVQVPVINNKEDEWECISKINNALLESQRHGGGPVHINLMTKCELFDFSIEKLPSVTNIERYTYCSTFPPLPVGKIAIFVGSHKNFSLSETTSIDNFCETNDAVVFCDHTSGYYGRFRVQYAIAAAQNMNDENMSIDLLIHIGEISGDYYTLSKISQAKNVWRVSPDGEARDYFKKLSKVFEIEERDFFLRYSQNGCNQETYITECKKTIESVRSALPEMPFSNMWAAQQLAQKLPAGSIVHLGILNSLRSWNFFELPKDVNSYCNVGGFGIDGILSTVIGASLANPEKLFYCIVGDLAFFYDMNSLGNRHIGRNLRIMLVNNGKGTEFRNHTHPGSKFGEDADLYIAAGGHYGNQSKELVRHYVEDLRFLYLSASNKEEFLDNMCYFTDRELNQSIVFELFTHSKEEDEALRIILQSKSERINPMKRIIKDNVKKVIGEKNIEKLKTLLE